MRTIAGLLALLTALAVAAPAARALEGLPDAQMLLDLDLLREADPRVHRQARMAGSVRLLEFLKRLQAPGASGSDGDGRPSPKDAC